MHHRTTRAEHLAEGSRTAIVEGEPIGSGVSFFWVDAAPGEGPPLHRHPYPETWAVLAGTGEASIDGEGVALREGDVVVVGAGSAHRFRGTGEGRLRMMCMHASPRIVEEQLEG
ncbi:cupin domain-containing protein [Georgenia sp. SUBG003]|uniref:cupin domain-containing protein n=1 Tax=Georgenia sp. SUBG003 TaxID=1497974 RepID=UPI0004DA0BFA|nr:hypothetical protein DA06_00850 [Georgenia sp. SUBG003]